VTPVIGLMHLGIAVDDLRAAGQFWEGLLGRSAHGPTLIDAPRIGEIVGVPGATVEMAWIDLPGAGVLELLEYDPHAVAAAGATDAGAVHICLEVNDADSARQAAIALGAQPLSAGAVDVPDGPAAGSRVAYLRAPGATLIEVWERSPK